MTAPAAAVSDTASESRRSAAAKPSAAREPEQPAKPKQLTALKGGELQLREFRNYDFVGTACAGAQPQDYDGEAGQAMWSIVAQTLHAWDLVCLVGRDGTWWAQYVVVFADEGQATAKLIAQTDVPVRRMDTLADLLASMPKGFDDYSIRRGDPSEDPWVVFRRSDGFVLNRDMGHRTPEEARRFLLDHPIFRKDGGRPTYFP